VGQSFPQFSPENLAFVFCGMLTWLDN